MARPAFRIVAAPKKGTDAEGEEKLEVGVLWESRIEGAYNLDPVDKKKAKESNGRKRPLAEVLNGNYFLNVYPNDPEDF